MLDFTDDLFFPDAGIDTGSIVGLGQEADFTLSPENAQQAVRKHLPEPILKNNDVARQVQHRLLDRHALAIFQSRMHALSPDRDVESVSRENA